MNIKLLQPDVNLSTIKDGRGGIFTYYPVTGVIKEWNYIVTHKGEKRGQHYHKEFDEYIMFVEGHGCYTEEEKLILVGPGDCIHIPANTKHVFTPLEDCKLIALLTKRWEDCEEPITKF